MKIHSVLSVLIFLLVLVATTTGIFYQTPGSPIAYITVRGENAVYQGSGLYRYDPAWFAREGIVWDIINLVVGLPLFVMAIYQSQRNSLRGQLLLGGLMFYFVYVYLMALTGYAFNRLFLIYVAIAALSAVVFFINLHDIDVAQFPTRISARFPRRLFIGFTFTVAVTLILLWTGRIVPIMINDRFPPEIAGVSTLISQGIDLVMVVPLMLSTGTLLWRRSAWGYLLTGVSLGYGLLMSITLPAFIIVPLMQDGKTTLVEAIPFSLVSLAGIYLVGRFYVCVQD